VDIFHVSRIIMNIVLVRLMDNLSAQKQSSINSSLLSIDSKKSSKDLLE